MRCCPPTTCFFALAPQPVLEKQISESIISPEEMADTASVTLHDLRRKIRQTEDSIRTKLDNIIRNSTTNKFLQDAVVSLRNGRYVVPVRAEYRGEVGGVIHDVSSTGATVFVEPTAVVEANARIMQLRAQEQEEITRILTSFSTQVGSLEPQFTYSYDAMLKIDLLLAKARLAVEQNAFMPAVSDTVHFKLNKARHPLIDKKNGRACGHRAGQRVRHPRHHRPEHRRQDRFAQNRGPSQRDGPVRLPDPRAREQHRLPFLTSTLWTSAMSRASSRACPPSPAT